MKWSFDVPTLVFGGLNLLQKTTQRLQEAEQDGKIDKKELSHIALTGFMEALSVLLMASKIDDKPLVPKPTLLDESPVEEEGG